MARVIRSNQRGFPHSVYYRKRTLWHLHAKYASTRTAREVAMEQKKKFSGGGRAYRTTILRGGGKRRLPNTGWGYTDRDGKLKRV